MESLPEIDNRYTVNEIKKKKRKIIFDDVEIGDQSKKQKLDDAEGHTYVTFDIDNKFESFKLIQIESHPQKPVLVSGNFVLF